MARILKVALVALLLTGCTAIAHVRAPDPRWSEPVDYRVCVAGESEPDLTRHAVADLARYGLRAAVAPYPEDVWLPTPADFEQQKTHDMDDTPGLISLAIFIQQIPCDMTLYYRTRSGHSQACLTMLIGGMCVRGFGWQRPSGTEAVVILYVRSEPVLSHEIQHALGCRHEHSADECRDAITATRERLKADG